MRISGLLSAAACLGCVSPAWCQYPPPYPIYAPYANPYAGNLYGAASVINAQSQQIIDENAQRYGG